MLYRRRPYPNRQNPHFDTGTVEGESRQGTGTYETGNSEGIPLPNEMEDSPEDTDNMPSTHRSSVFDFFKNRIRLEEIILLGLIFVLLDEGIDDDFLLIMLVYILLT